MRHLKHILGMEGIDTVSDEPVSPEQEAEAEAVLEEEHLQDDADYQKQQAEFDDSQAAREEAEALEDFCGILGHGLETQDYQPQLAAAVNAYARRYGNLGLEGSDQLSLEHYDPADLEQFYTVSQEFFGKVWQKMKKGFKDRFELSVSNYREADRDDRRQARARAMKTKATALQQRLNELPNGKVTIELGDAFRVFTSQGSLVKNMDKALERDAKSVEFILRNYVPSTLKWLEGMRAVSVQALGAASISSDGSIGQAKEEVEKFFKNRPYPGTLLTRELLDGSGFVNNERMRYDPEPRRGSDTADIINSQVNTIPPYMGDCAVKAPKKGTVTVTKAELSGMLKVIHQYAKLLSLSSSETRGVMKNLQADVKLHYPEGQNAPWMGADQYVVERLLSLLMFAPEFIDYAMTGTYRHIGKVTDGVFCAVECALAQVNSDEE